MIAIFGSGIIGLFIAHKLLKQGKQVKIFEYKNNEGNSTDASVGMLAPLIEAKPYEKKLFELFALLFCHRLRIFSTNQHTWLCQGHGNSSACRCGNG